MQPAQRSNPNSPLWNVDTAMPAYPPLTRDLSVDVVIAGGGIAGLTAAVVLQRAGKQVALIEAHRIGGGETGRTTAHLTEQLDTRYHTLESRFGREGAREAARSSRAAIDFIEALVAELPGSCGFRRVPGFLFAETAEQREELEQELACMQHAGCEVSWVEALDVPFETKGALRLERQAQVHPLQYLRELAVRLVSLGGLIVEDTRMHEVQDGTPCRVHTDRGVLTANDVLVLTGVPVSNKFAVLTKIAAYRTYALAARVDQRFPEGLFADMQQPYHYLRTHEASSGTFLVVGGEDHKTGQKDDTEECFRDLERYVGARFPNAEIAHRWSGQVLEPVDGLPFIGRNTGAKHVYVATGFSGTGITFGTLAAMILSDEVLGVPNPWADLYQATRVKPLAQAREYLAENIDFPLHLIAERLSRAHVDRVEDVRPGEGKWVRSRGRTLAVYRGEDGRVHALSAVCTHLGCRVRWNPAERSWDCPCHGGRFDVDGNVLNGPPTKGLVAVPISSEEPEIGVARGR
jgi:glycine/D-amino acid oxidase-like deaminating enzyme/nitrite reductase/ring-hydroxylating ferredoxin subunit